MIVNEPGKSYTVQTANGHRAFDVVFCTVVNKEFIDGVTNEELLEVLIDRMSTLVKKSTTHENMNVLTHLQQSKQWLNVRNLNRMMNQKAKRNDHSKAGIRLQAEK